MIIAWCLDMVVMMVLGWREILLGGRFISWLSIQMMRMMNINSSLFVVITITAT